MQLTGRNILLKPIVFFPDSMSHSLTSYLVTTLQLSPVALKLTCFTSKFSPFDVL